MIKDTLIAGFRVQSPEQESYLKYFELIKPAFNNKLKIEKENFTREVSIFSCQEIEIRFLKSLKAGVKTKC